MDRLSHALKWCKDREIERGDPHPTALESIYIHTPPTSSEHQISDTKDTKLSTNKPPTSSAQQNLEKLIYSTKHHEWLSK